MTTKELSSTQNLLNSASEISLLCLQQYGYRTAEIVKRPSGGHPVLGPVAFKEVGVEETADGLQE